MLLGWVKSPFICFSLKNKNFGRGIDASPFVECSFVGLTWEAEGQWETKGLWSCWAGFCQEGWRNSSLFQMNEQPLDSDSCLRPDDFLRIFVDIEYSQPCFLKKDVFFI